MDIITVQMDHMIRVLRGRPYTWGRKLNSHGAGAGSSLYFKPFGANASVTETLHPMHTLTTGPMAGNSSHRHIRRLTVTVPKFPHHRARRSCQQVRLSRRLQDEREPGMSSHILPQSPHTPNKFHKTARGLLGPLLQTQTRILKRWNSMAVSQDKIVQLVMSQYGRLHRQLVNQVCVQAGSMNQAFVQTQS